MIKVCHIINTHSPFDNRVFYKEIGALRDKFANYIFFNCQGKTEVKNIGGQTKLHLDNNFEGEFEGVKFIGYSLTKHFFPKARYQSFVNQICKKMMDYDFDLLHIHEWPYLVEAALEYRAVKGPSVKLIFDSHEFYDGYALMRNKINPKVSLFETFKKKQLIADRFDGVITVSYPMYVGYKLRNIDLPVEMVENGASDKPDIHQERESKRDELKMVFEGHLSYDRGLDVILRGCKTIKEEGLKASVHTIGKIDSKVASFVKKYVSENGLEKVFINHSWVPPTELPAFVSEFDLGLCIFNNQENNIFGLPNKFFSYLSCGIGIIASNSPELKRIIDEHKCGFVFKENTPDAFMEIVKEALANPDKVVEAGHNALRLQKEKYSWRIIGKKLVRFYNQIIEQPAQVSILSFDPKTNGNSVDLKLLRSTNYQEGFPVKKMNFVYQTILKHINVLENPDIKIVDVGCGAGALAQLLFKSGFTNYIGIDTDEQDLKNAKERVPEWSDRFVKKSCFEINDLDYEVIVAESLLEKIDDLKFIRMLKSGTYLMMTLPNFWLTDKSTLRVYKKNLQIFRRFRRYLKFYKKYIYFINEQHFIKVLMARVK